MRTENFEGGIANYFDKEENWTEKLDLVETQLAGPVQGKSRKDLEDYASYLRIKIEESQKGLPN